MGKGRSLRKGVEVGPATFVAGKVLVPTGVTAAIVSRIASSVSPLPAAGEELHASIEETNATKQAPNTRCVRFIDHP